MKRKVRIFIYALMAWFVGLAVITYDFAVSYAASFNDVADAEWKYVVGGYVDDVTKNTGIEDMPFEIPEGRPSTCPGLSKSTKYEENFAYSQGEPWYGGCNYTIGSDSEIVLFLTWSNTEDNNAVFNQYRATSLQQCNFQVGSMLSFYISKTDITAKGQGYMYRSGWVEESGYSRSEVTCSKNDLLKDYAVYSFFCGANGSGAAMKTGKVKVFNTAEGVMNYLEYGDTSGMAWNGAAPEYDGENIYLNDFQMIVHDSNAYSAYYIEFKYMIPDQLKTAQSLVLDIAEQYSYCVTAVASLARLPSEYSGTNKIDLLQYPSGFKLYLKDINAVKSFVDKAVLSTDGMAMRRVLGSEGYLDSDYLSLDGLGLNTICQITNSKLYLTCYVVANGKYGQSVNGDVDFLSGSNGMGTYTPDASGNYSYNGDYKNNGHYYDQVGTDAAGNASHTYYYYDTDNSKNNITSNDFSNNTYTPGASSSVGAVIQNNNVTLPDHIFVTVSGSSGSSGSGSDVGNVTIEDDDLSFDSLRESIKDGYGLIDDTDTGVKGDGLIAMLSDLFGYLPAKFVGLIMLGTSSVVGIAVLRMIFKR